MKLDRTHDPELRSWVESANAPHSDFPIQNLPFGVFRRKRSGEPLRGGVAIGEQILELAALGVKTGRTLNSLAAQGRPAWRRLRAELSRVLSAKNARWKALRRYLVPMKSAELSLPLAVGNYSDFYAGIHHATNVGRLLRPDNPLMPNYKWLPIGYHGRASSIVVSGTAVVRPKGQLKPPEAAAPMYAPCKRLDYEVELGLAIGPGNRLGLPIPIGKARAHVFGVMLLNDWSARDIQTWEYQPLGPFLGKSFATTLSPWVVTMEALEPFRCPAYPRAAGDPRPLPYLHDEEDEREGGYDIGMEMYLRTPRMKSAARLSRASFRDSYWTLAQIVAHQSSNGCDLRAGDLLGSGTISGATAESFGSLMELSQAGRQPLALPDGQTRTFLEDGDEVVLRGRCAREGFASIGFGEAAGRVRPALT